MAACGSPPPSRTAAAPSVPPAAEAGFESPPRVTAVRPLPSGGTALVGAAVPGATVRLATPQGRAFSTTVGESGAWTIEVPRLDEATLFGLSARDGERVVQAEGYLALLPPPGAGAVMLRAGAGAHRIGPRPRGVRVDAVDLDAAGAAVVSGAAPPSAALTAWIDGSPAGEGIAGAGGAFALALTQPLTPGMHTIAVRGSGAAGEGRLEAGRPRRPQAGPYGVKRIEGAWRIDWMTPGGGLQTTVVFDPAGAGA